MFAALDVWNGSLLSSTVIEVHYDGLGESQFGADVEACCGWLLPAAEYTVGVVGELPADATAVPSRDS